jgi:hypothetical protein
METEYQVSFFLHEKTGKLMFRPWKPHSKESDQMRKRVAKVINDAIKYIDKRRNHELSNHLKSHIKKGFECYYDPGLNPIKWYINRN